MIKYFLKFLIFLYKATLGISVGIIMVITIGAFIAAVFYGFPVVGIIVGAAALSFVIYKVVIFVKDKKEKKLLREAEENRQKEIDVVLKKYKKI